jgi:flagellar protein FlbD
LFSLAGEFMIVLHRLNKQEYILNAELIKMIETIPDTVITLVSGEKLIVRESVDEVCKKVLEYKASIYYAFNQVGRGAE